MHVFLASGSSPPCYISYLLLCNKYPHKNKWSQFQRVRNLGVASWVVLERVSHKVVVKTWARVAVIWKATGTGGSASERAGKLMLAGGKKSQVHIMGTSPLACLSFLRAWHWPPHSEWSQVEQDIDPNVFYDLLSEVISPHFHEVLLITQVSPVQQEVTSWRWESLGIILEIG